MFDAALHLHGFGGFVSEALDELFRICDHLLLVEIRPHLLLMPLLAQFDKMAVIDIVVIDTSECDLNRSRAGIVNESAVVTDHEYRRRARFEEVLEPLDRFDVQVVGGLVKEQQVRVTKKNLRQFNTHPPSSGELATRSVEVFALKAEANDGAIHFCDEAGFISRRLSVFIRLVNRHHFLAEGAVVMEEHDLRQIAYSHICISCDTSGSRLVFACDESE